MAESKGAGPSLLAAEIERRGITRAAAAGELGLQPSTIHHYLVTGVYRPRGETRERIAQWSEGRVPVGSWDTVKEGTASTEIGDDPLDGPAADAPPDTQPSPNATE